MKKVLSIAFLFCLAVQAFAQQTVSGTVTDLSSSPVANHNVTISSNVRTGPGSFVPLKATTNTSGQYSATLPTGIPNNTGIIVETNDCSSTVVVNNHNYSGANITSNFSICVGNPSTGISGIVYINNTTKRSIRAVVYRIQKCSGTPTTLSLIDSMVTDTTGAYSFSNYPTLGSGCDLLMKAALLSSDPDYSSYLPSYHVSFSTSALLWSGATSITPQIAANGIDIKLTAGTNPGGPGFIGGSVVQGANKGTGPGDPVVNRLFLLTDNMNNAVAYTYSDATGTFGFGNLPYGTYKVFGDAWGKDNIALTITIDNTTPAISSIVFVESSKKLEGYNAPASVTSVTLASNVSVYPNPVTDVVKVGGLNTIDGNKQIIMTDVTGSVVYNTEIGSDAIVSIPATHLPNGIYMVRIATSAGTLTYKIAK